MKSSPYIPLLLECCPKHVSSNSNDKQGMRVQRQSLVAWSKFYIFFLRGGGVLQAMGVGMGGSGSDISTTEMEKESKVKGKLKSLFKSGPPNRSQR